MTAIVRLARPDDRPRVLELLAAANLPLDGVAEHFASFYVAVDGSAVLGSAGLEFHGPYALLRSVVVEAGAQGMGVGSVLTRRALNEATARGVLGVYLLTTTAEEFFGRFGFKSTSRQEAPAPLQESIEFRSACPASAVTMRLGMANLHSAVTRQS